MNKTLTFGSVCSGIEAAQLAFSPHGMKQLWSSEIADFPCKVLDYHYPDVPNVGDMVGLPRLISEGSCPAPDVFCGGTPCQAFSLAGWKNGLLDERGQLTLMFIEIANAIDRVRAIEGKNPAVVLWENVEGVLNDKTNAFGIFLAGLAGYDEELVVPKWTRAGLLVGKQRSVAWRVIDAKYYGLPQQRRRLYVLAGSPESRPDRVLFEFGGENVVSSYKGSQPKKQRDMGSFFRSEDPLLSTNRLIVEKNGSRFEFFRKYTDCLYSAYGTKWNGNAAAYNGSLYVAQNNRVRRLTPLECERLMGFPDDYTLVPGSSDTKRYQAVGNSWSVPVVKWIGGQILSHEHIDRKSSIHWEKYIRKEENNLDAKLFLLNGVHAVGHAQYLNASELPNAPVEGEISDVVQSADVAEKFYLSPQACKGILRRRDERDISMNPDLERLLLSMSEDGCVVSRT